MLNAGCIGFAKGLVIMFEISDLPHGKVAWVPMANAKTPADYTSSIEKISS